MRSKEVKVNILVFNPGSSSLKYKIIRMPDETEIVTGEAERLGVRTDESARITHTVLGRTRVVDTAMQNHADAFREAMALIRADAAACGEAVRVGAVAHRYVHPGRHFERTARITGGVMGTLRKTLELAPIHNPISYRLIELCRAALPDLPAYAVFDSVFHKTIPKELATYALPSRLARAYGIRKVGFHGISHRYVMQEACAFLGREAKTQKIVSCHLGTGGASVCAIRYGASLNSSMGFTPLEGLIMNTRSGDVDLGVVFYLMFREGLGMDEAETILNRKSGLLGASVSSSDLRDVIKAMGTDERARTAFRMYIKRVRKYVSFYAMLLGRADIISFTDSVGMTLPLVREEVLAGFDFLGIRLDREKNRAYAGGIAEIAAPGSETKILVVPTDEELMIAREAYEVLSHDSRR